MKNLPAGLGVLFLIGLLVLSGCGSAPEATPDKTCVELKGKTCKTNETCSGGSVPAKDTKVCCTGTCVLPKPKITDFNVGQSFEITKDINLTINGVRFVDKIAETKEQLPPAPAEQIYALIDVTLENNTGDVFKLSDKSFQFILSDDAKYSYQIETKGQAVLYNNFFAGATGSKSKGVDVLAGLSKRGEIAFAINKSAAGLVVHIIPEKSKIGFNISLTNNPNASEFDPATKEIVQGLVGEQIVGDDVKITVNGVRYVKTVDEKDSDTSFAETEKGKMFAVVSISVQNISGGEVDLSKTYETIFKDAQDVSYLKDTKATSALLKPFATTKIATNDPITGELAYNLPIQTTGPYLSITFAKGKKLYQVPLAEPDQAALLSLENLSPKCSLTIDSVFFNGFKTDSDTNITTAKAEQVETTLTNTGKNRFSGTWDLTIKDTNSKIVERDPGFRTTSGRFRVGRSLKDAFSLGFEFPHNLGVAASKNYSILIDIRDADKPEIICSVNKAVTVQ